MNKVIKPGFWIVFFLVACVVVYQLFGWIGVLVFIAAGALCGAATIPINRKVREDERKARFHTDR